MDQYRNILKQFKRKQPGSLTSSSEGESPDISRQVSKRLYLEAESDEMEEQMSKLMSEINSRFDQLQKSLASKDDIRKLKNELGSEIESLHEKFSKKIDEIEEHVKMFNEVSVLKRTNTDLFSQLTNQNKQLAALRKSRNDMEQHGRMWNLWVFNVAESRTDEPESTAACTKKVCNICTELVGGTVREGNIEIAHTI
ncbi:hypothetical protein ACOMHN_061095 [Nucella lapillus]